MSTIIIRLQNLPLSAKAADIREFFGDLKIPKGSVNIVGGHLGDAFIGFASDEDARLAMLLDGRLLHNSKIRLMLSSKREMEQVISSAQAFAGKGASMNQTENNQNTFSPPDPSQKESTVKLEGSVNIVGGHLGDAFIGFASDEDARLAMLLDGRLLHNSKIRLMLSSKREMEQVISSAQAFAGKGASMNQTENNQNTFSPPDPSQKESTVKLEVNSPLPGFPYTQQPPVSTFQQQQSTQQNLLEQQQAATQLQQAFGNDSWKTPNYPPTTQQQQQIIQQQTSRQVPTVFEGTGGNVQSNVVPFGQQQQHQYQQLIQNFPPGQPPPSQQFRIQPPSIRPAQPSETNFPPGQPPPSQQFRIQPPSIRPCTTGNLAAVQSINLYNTQQQNILATRFSGPTQTGQPQQTTFYSNPPPQQRTQFTRGGGLTQSFGQQQFGGSYRGGHKTFGGPRFPGQQRSFDSDRGGGDKRRRSRSPANEQRKRLNIVSNNENDTSTTKTTAASGEYGKGRFCVQLSNVPYKAAFNDINEYLSLAKAGCIKVTRVYIPDKNYTDRWIVEFDNEENSRALIKFRGEIFARTIRAELIPNRRADEQYAVAEPDERDRGRFRREIVRRDRSRSRSRNRDRSRSRDRQRDSKDRPSSREDSGRSRRRSISPSTRKRSSSRERFPRERTREFNRDEHRNRDGGDFGSNQPYQQRRNSTFVRRGARTYDNNNNNGGGSNNNSHQPVPLFGAFAFPSTQANQAVYNPKTGSTVQLGAKDLKPLPLRSFGGPPSQFFPTPTSSSPNFRFPSIQIYQNGPPPQINNNRNGGNIQIQQQQQPTSPPTQIQISPHFRPQFGQNLFSGLAPNFTINNTRMPGQNLMSFSGGGINNLRQSQQQSPPKSSSPTHSYSMDTCGSALIIQEDNCSVDGKGNESSGEMSSSIKNAHDIPSMSSSSLPYALTSIPDQPPIDLLEPNNDGEESNE
uniref:RRM domain-containing protein n=2 Tax=Meloidogyne TaxID=189290 RepID=A0A914KU06_MELIC